MLCEPESTADSATLVRRDAAQMMREAQIAGVQLMPHAADCGEALAVDVRGIPDTTANRLLSAAADHRPVTLTVRFGDYSGDPLRQFERFCRCLHEVCRDVSPAARDIGLVVDADRVAPQAARALQRQHLGGGWLVMLLHSHSDRNTWLQAWQLRNDPLVHIAMPAHVHSPCAMLAPEPADGVLPKLLLQVPVASAWLPMRIDVSRFAAADGELQYAALDRALGACVAVGDSLHDVTRWPSAGTRHDAWFNRRLAIDIDGVGELVRLRGSDPCSMEALVELRCIIRHARETLCRCSLQLAAAKGMLPSIEQTDPGRQLPPGNAKDDWRMRWKRAVKDVSFRNRNIVTMSPWSLLARCGKADFRHTNLLPLIRNTDAVAFNRSVSVAHWNSSEFKEFHLRLAAVLRQKNTAALFAERV